MNQIAIHPDEPIPYKIVELDKPVAGMLLHCGADLVGRPTLFSVPTPREAPITEHLITFNTFTEAHKGLPPHPDRPQSGPSRAFQRAVWINQHQQKMKNDTMKSMVITIVLILLAGTMLTSCDESKATKTTEAPETFTPPGPDPVKVLEKQVVSERELREAAEGRAEEASSAKDRWQLSTLGLGLLTVVAFFGGTAIGSRGRHHASSTS